MAITRLYDFRGEAEVAGVLRTVRYRHDDGLTVEGISLEEANRLLGALATGHIKAAATSDNEPRTGLGEVQQVMDAKPGKPGPTPMADATAEKEPAEKPAEEKPKKRKKKPQAEAKSNGASNGAKPAEKPEKPKAKAKPEPEPEEAEEGEEEEAEDDGNGGELVAKLQDAKKLREVVGAMADAGITTPDALVAKCLDLKDAVPLLKRIGDIERRVRRTAAAMGIGDDGDAAEA